MRQRFRRTARYAAVATMPLVFMAAQPVVDGMTYEFVMKSSSKATGNKETVTMRGRGTYAGDDARIEILEAGSGAGGQDVYGGKGTYFIVKGGGKEMLLVNPAEKSYMKWDLSAMMAGLGSAMNVVGGMVKMQMSDVKIDAQDMGAGPSIQGHATRHIRMIQNYTVSASVLGRTSKNRTETTTDYYIASNLRIPNPFVSTEQANAMMAQFDMFNTPEYKNQMAAANAKMPKTGAPLRWVATTITTDEKGKQETSTATMEMVNFKTGNIPASEFEIPSGYTKVEMPAMTAGAKGSAGKDGKSGFTADSIGAAAKEGAKESAKKEAKDAAKEAVSGAAGKVKGIFGKKKKGVDCC